MYGDGLQFYGDLEFPEHPNEYDWMSVGLAMSGMVMAFDVRYLMFSTEALMTTAHGYSQERRDDGTYEAPSIEQLQRTLHPSADYNHQQAWLEGDENITQTLLVCIADTKLGRTWSITLPFKYELGNKVNWLPLVEDMTQGPDYRSTVWGAMLVPAVIRSQYDYLLIRPGPLEAVEYVFASGMTMSIADGTPLAEALTSYGAHMVPIEEIEAIRYEQEEMIKRAVDAMPDSLPDDWNK